MGRSRAKTSRSYGGMQLKGRMKKVVYSAIGSYALEGLKTGWVSANSTARQNRHQSLAAALRFAEHDAAPLARAAAAHGLFRRHHAAGFRSYSICINTTSCSKRLGGKNRLLIYDSLFRHTHIVRKLAVLKKSLESPSPTALLLMNLLERENSREYNRPQFASPTK